VEARYAAYAIVSDALGGLRASPSDSVTEYRGHSGRDIFDGHTVHVPSTTASPVSDAQRRAAYLQILGANMPAILALDDDIKPLAAVMRMAVVCAAEDPSSHRFCTKAGVTAMVDAA
jgi:hypothetical protein